MNTFKEYINEALKSELLDGTKLTKALEAAGYEVVDVASEIIFKKDDKKGGVWANSDKLKWIIDKGTFKAGDIKEIKDMVKACTSKLKETLVSARREDS